MDTTRGLKWSRQVTLAPNARARGAPPSLVPGAGSAACVHTYIPTFPCLVELGTGNNQAVGHSVPVTMAV